MDALAGDKKEVVNRGGCLVARLAGFSPDSCCGAAAARELASEASWTLPAPLP